MANHMQIRKPTVLPTIIRIAGRVSISIILTILFDRV